MIRYLLFILILAERYLFFSLMAKISLMSVFVIYSLCIRILSNVPYQVLQRKLMLILANNT